MSTPLPDRFGVSRSERASGVLSSVFGLAIMLGFLAITVHVAVGLWARTTTESIAYDAAREVATARTDNALVRSDAITRANSRLGSNAGRVELEFRPSPPEVVVLAVRSEPIGLLPAMAGTATIVGGLDKTITIRRELGPTP